VQIALPASDRIRVKSVAAAAREVGNGEVDEVAKAPVPIDARRESRDADFFRQVPIAVV